jgi:hypothetical protein
MEQPSKEGAVVQAPLSNQRWLTVEQLVPGMVLARPVVVAARGVLAMKLGEGCELTASLISQMYARGHRGVSPSPSRRRKRMPGWPVARPTPSASS